MAGDAFAPAPIMYKSASGYFDSCRIAKGIRRASPVRTNMLSSGRNCGQRVGAADLKTIPPITNNATTKKDGVKNFISCFLKCSALCAALYKLRIL